MDNELVELQSRIAFQEDTLLALNKTVARQQQEISRLQAELVELQQQVRSIAASQAGGPLDEAPPPHY